MVSGVRAMWWRFLATIVVVGALPSSGGSAAMDSATASIVIAVQRELFDERFESADSLSRSLIRRDPASPAGYLFAAGTLFAEMVAREESLDPGRFRALLDTADSLAAAALDTAGPETAAWMHLFLGHGKVYRSLWESRFGSFASAIKLARAARSEYQAGLERDSGLYDLYFGLGSYHYWKSAKAGVLRWLGLFKNEKDKGIRELYLAIDSSTVSKESARNSLIWIWLDRRQYDSVIAVCREMFRMYPEGKVFLWPLAEAYQKSGDYAAAAETYRLLREQLARQPGNYFNLIECDFCLYRCCEKLERSAEGWAVARSLSGYYGSIPKETRHRQRAKLAYLRRAFESQDGLGPAQVGVD